jgi:hypothetical protein
MAERDTSSGEADFYLDADNPPVMTFAGHVGVLLDAQGVWAELNRRLRCDPGDFFDRFEGYEVSLDRLGLLASGCRDLAERFVEGTVYEDRRPAVRINRGQRSEHYEVVTTATGEELRAALATLADLADRAGRENRTIWADLF